MTPQQEFNERLSLHEIERFMSQINRTESQIQRCLEGIEEALREMLPVIQKQLSKRMSNEDAEQLQRGIKALDNIHLPRLDAYLKADLSDGQTDNKEGQSHDA